MENYKSKGIKRDILDTVFTYVNRELLICKLFYFFFFAAFGSLYPLLAIYFKQLGMNATQSGLLIGFRPFIEFLSAPFWGGVADKLRKWKQLMLFSLFCWIAFTLAMAAVKPGKHACVDDLNTTIGDVSDLIKPAYSTVFYKKGDVHDAFFALLLIVVIGEFFSAPAITFADTVTLSYLGEDTDNYGRQRMYGSLGWGLAMFFVGMALDHSTTHPQHPCKDQHQAEKNYIICFAVFTVLMTCAFITATQFKFPGQEGDITLPNVVLAVKDKVKSTITGKSNIDRQRLVEEDDDIEAIKKENGGDTNDAKTSINTQQSNGQQVQYTKDPTNEKPLQITLQSKPDMVSDVINSPGAIQSVPDPEDPFMGRWMTVIRLLAQVKYISVLFVVWFMGFGIGLIFTFLFWYLQDLGGSPTLFGLASVINHISELLAYFLASSFITQLGHINVLYLGLIGNIARFLYISWLVNPWWVLPFECIQGLTHAAVWATTCSYITHAIPVGLRSSAQGILQGIHHGLGRGCGAVFGGILVYNYGSEITFRAYGITCIFVLAAFFGSNFLLKRQGVILDPKLPMEKLDEEKQLHMDPHGVPSGIARDLSSSKLNKQDEPVSSYGATLGTSARETLSEAFNTPPSQLPDTRKAEPPLESVPKNPFTGQPLVPNNDVTVEPLPPLQATSQKRDRSEEYRGKVEDQQEGNVESSQKRRHSRKRDSLDGKERDSRDNRGSSKEGGYDQPQDTRRSSREAYEKQPTEKTKQRDNGNGYDQGKPRESSKQVNSGYDQPGDRHGSRDTGNDQPRDRQGTRDTGYDQPRDRQGSRDPGYDQPRDKRGSRDTGYEQPRDPYGSREPSNDQPRERSGSRGGSGYDQPRERRGSRDSSDQSNDRERGQHEGYDQGQGQVHRKSHRRSVDSGEGSYRPEHRSHRHHHKKRRSLDEFSDMDPNPKEQVVFEKLPDLTTRKFKQQQQQQQQQQQESRPEGEELFRPF